MQRCTENEEPERDRQMVQLSGKDGIQKQFPRNPGRAAPEVAASSEIKEAQPLTPRLIDR